MAFSGFFLATLLLAGCPGAWSAGSSLPRFDHIVIVIEENHSLSQVAESAYLSSLAGRGTLFAQSYAVAHPSEPNYVALFSGSTHGIHDDGRYDLTGPNLASSLEAADLSFAGYSEDLPVVGFRGDSYQAYVRKHNPLAIFTSVPDADNRPFTDFPTGDFAALPTVSFVIPNLRHDMHDGSVAEGDEWLQANLESYVQWAARHNSVLIVTFDEGPFFRATTDAPMATIMVGARVRVGVFDQSITHYSILRLVEDIYGLPYIGEDRSAPRITGIWD